jgi:pilus assembly protein Flp/PilA
MRQRVAKFLVNDSGATAIEYSLIASMIALAIVGSVTALSGKVQSTYSNIANGLK